MKTKCCIHNKILKASKYTTWPNVTNNAIIKYSGLVNNRREKKDERNIDTIKVIDRKKPRYNKSYVNIVHDFHTLARKEKNNVHVCSMCDSLSLSLYIYI